MIETDEVKEVEHRRTLLVNQLLGFEFERQRIGLEHQLAGVEYDARMNEYHRGKCDVEKEIADLDAWLAKRKGKP